MNFAGVQSVMIPEGDVKSIAIGGVTVWTKPNPLPYDAEVEYLESTGTQYVDTGLYANTTNTRCEIKLRPTANNTTVGILGSRNVNSGDLRSACNVFIVGGNFRFDWVAGDGTLSIPSVVGQVYEMNITRPTLTINGTTYTKTNNGSYNQKFHFLLFSFWQQGGPYSSGFVGAIYSCKIYSSSTLVRDYIPVRKGTTGYLYDRANPTGGPLGNGLYGNNGTGAFVVGPDKNGG